MKKKREKGEIRIIWAKDAADQSRPAVWCVSYGRPGPFTAADSVPASLPFACLSAQQQPSTMTLRVVDDVCPSLFHLPVKPKSKGAIGRTDREREWHAGPFN